MINKKYMKILKEDVQEVDIEIVQQSISEIISGNKKDISTKVQID